MLSYTAYRYPFALLDALSIKIQSKALMPLSMGVLIFIFKVCVFNCDMTCFLASTSVRSALSALCKEVSFLFFNMEVGVCTRNENEIFSYYQKASLNIPHVRNTDKSTVLMSESSLHGADSENPIGSVIGRFTVLINNNRPQQLPLYQRFRPFMYKTQILSLNKVLILLCRALRSLNRTTAKRPPICSAMRRLSPAATP
uniref:Uncharacterized protein n=1 Tax=Romanomermis culicivorax TaxID=13658 RepID=A0A915KYW7_ROMCU